MRLVALGTLILALLALGCGDEASAGGDPTPCRGEPELTENGVVVSDNCHSRITLLPMVKTGGSWHAATAPCSPSGSSLGCSVQGLGDVTVSLDGTTLGLSFTPSADQTVEGLALDGTGTVTGATSWLSNGFQSWSESGMVALSDPPSDDELEKALMARGDGEVVRDGWEVSWSFTLVGGGRASLFAGALSAERWRTWAAVHRDGSEGLRLRLVSGGAGEKVNVTAGESVAAEPWRVEIGEPASTEVDWSSALTSRAKTTPRPASAGWNSWYQLWDGVDEAAVRENAPLAKQLLEPIVPPGTPLRIVIDDGWQKAWGDWEPNAKFPAGLAGLTADLKSQGFETGIWLAPLLVAESSETAQAHPEWLVQGASYKHGKHGVMYVLDPTQPEAAKHLESVISQIVGWGFGLLKIDFLFAGTFEGTRAEDVTPMQAYARALQIIRTAAGEDTLLTAVGAPGLASLPYVDGWRVGGDIALETTDVGWPFIPNQARCIATRWPLCRATACDGDPVLLRRLAQNEVEAGGYVASFAAGAFFLSDDLRLLPEERLTWGIDAQRAAWGVGKLPLIPRDPFPADPPDELSNVLIDLVSKKNSHVVPDRWRAEDGTEVLLNVDDEPRRIASQRVEPHSAVVTK
jgi:hypothetical protein